ncbi:uncharacterized protein LOC130665442 isoform X3 [Microplitis mediator]|uniref:uncharacterized protein LOC130665442 isoform X3 n=1 Tax=Microplitis mediator TaxID=375433 RepID=UPI00255442A2|nr:uncharacterized protein LOC130665442 isoform X3 [Microplitis mediator]
MDDDDEMMDQDQDCDETQDRQTIQYQYGDLLPKLGRRPGSKPAKTSAQRQREYRERKKKREKCDLEKDCLPNNENTIGIDKNTKDEISTPIKSFQSFVADENLLPNKKPIYDDTYNPLSQIKIINVESLSEKKNCWMENDSSINTYTTQRPPLIRVKSEFSEKKMIERKFSIDEDTNTDYQTKILSSDTISVKNIPKKYLPIVLLHRIVVPKKSLDPPAVVIKTEKEELENFSIKTEYDESKPTEQPVQPSKISNSHGPTAYKCTKFHQAEV